MITTQLPDGTAVHHQHDQAGRLTYNKYTDGSWEAWEYDKAGRLTKAYNRDSVTEFVRNALGQVIKETQDGHSIMRKYDRAGHHVHTESSLGASIDYSHDKDGNLSEMNSGGWSARWQRDRVGLETERELTGGVHIKTHHDSLGRETYKSVGARNVEQFRRSYTWGIGNRLHATEDGLTGRRVRYDYDEFDNLLSAEYKQGNDVERIYRIPDRIGNLFETREKDDRKYGAGSRLTEDRDYFYHYDCEGNLVFKEFKELSWGGGIVAPINKERLETELGIRFRAFGTGWRYDWQSDGMLARVVRPDGKEVSFAYDALGRRIRKSFAGTTTHFVWDGNIPLHEWTEEAEENVVTWLFEQDTFVPAAKLVANGGCFSIISDYLGTPLQAYDKQGDKVWEQELDIYGRQRKRPSAFVPFKYQGQYEDAETGLYYNRFRYYDPNAGSYISQDPISVAGGLNVYSYVYDTSTWIDILGLSPVNADRFPSWMDTKQGYERHHIIPYEHRSHEIFKVTGMNVNNATNMVYLPVTESIHPTKAVHHEFMLNGKPHAEYNALMGRELDDLLERSKMEGWTVERTRQELLILERDTRNKLNNARNHSH